MIRYEDITFKIGGNIVRGVRDWQSFQVLATYENDNNQANISTSSLTLVLDAYDKLIEHVDGGNIFRPLSISIALNSQYNIFEGFIDTTDDMSIDRERKEAKVKIKKSIGLNSFADRSQVVTSTLLRQQKKIKNANYVNVPYVKIQEFDFVSTALLALSTYILVSEVTDLIADSAETVGDSGAETAGSVSTGWLGAIVNAVADVAILSAKNLALLVQLLSVAKQIRDLLNIVVRHHKAMLLKDYISIGCEHIGYEFISSIPELNDLVYLPTKTKRGAVIKGSGNRDESLTGASKYSSIGHPTAQDPLYTLADAIGLAKEVFNAKIKIEGKKVYLESLNNREFWDGDSGYVMRDVLLPEEKYNTYDLKATRLISFSTDANDLFTLENYKGTTYEIHTNYGNNNEPNNVLLKGGDLVSLPVALGNIRKGGIKTLLEVGMTAFFDAVNKALKKFTGNKSITKEINASKVLIMSSNEVNVPKLMRMKADGNDYKLSTKHRDNWSAKYLYDNYHNYKSFVTNPSRTQFKLYDKVKMDATFEEFLQVLDNNKCRDIKGNEIELTSLLYNFAGAYWEADIKVYYTYVRDLEETFIESDGDTD